MRMFRKLENLKLGDALIHSARVEVLGHNAIIYGVKREDFLKASLEGAPCVMEVSGHTYKVKVNGASRVPETLIPDSSNIYLEVESTTGDALYILEGDADANRVES